MKATQTVYWPGKETLACDYHADKLQRLADFMGFTLGSTKFDGDAPCANCENEAKKP